MVDKIVTISTFDTQVTVVDNAIKRGSNLEDEIVLYVQLQVAAHTAVRTGSRYDSIGLDHLLFRFILFFF